MKDDQVGRARQTGQYPPRDPEPRPISEEPPAEWPGSYIAPLPINTSRRRKRSSLVSGMFDIIETNRQQLANLLTLAVVVILIGSIGWLIVYSMFSEPEPREGSSSAYQAPSYPPGFDSTYSVTLCDMNMRAQVAVPSSYRAAGQWRIAERDGLMGISRAFTAQNRMGVELLGEYTCLVDGRTNRIVGLQFVDGGRTVTLGPGDLRQ